MSDAYRQTIEEATELGFRLPPPLEPWAKSIGDALQTACDAASAKGLKLDSLRLIDVVLDMRAAALEWQRELGERESGVSDTSHGNVAGKAVTWISRSGNEVPCAIVILSARLVPALLDGSRIALTVLIHELAHVHEGVMALNAGHRTPPPFSGDIPALRKCIAAMIWEEYFAERFAASWSADDDFDVASWMPLVREKHDRIKALRSEWARNARLTGVLEQSSDPDRRCQSSARACPRSVCQQAPALQADFIEAMSFAPRWQKVARAIVGILDEMYARSDATSAAGANLGPLVADRWDRAPRAVEEKAGPSAASRLRRATTHGIASALSR